jgi:ankyrin repeat protein
MVEVKGHRVGRFSARHGNPNLVGMGRILRCTGYAALLVAALLIPMSAHPDAQISFSTPLHWAAANGQTKLAEMLLANGAAPGGADSWGRTPLHVGVRYRDVMALLIEKGANVNARDHFLNTPLHLAVAYREVVELLISKGADVNAKNVFGKTPLDICLSRGDSPYNVSIAELLVKAGAGAFTTAAK